MNIRKQHEQTGESVLPDGRRVVEHLNDVPRMISIIAIPATTL